jgi:hypothetical protein
MARIPSDEEKGESGSHGLSRICHSRTEGGIMLTREQQIELFKIRDTLQEDSDWIESLKIDEPDELEKLKQTKRQKVPYTHGR